MEDHNVDYFRNVWQINMSDLENQCETWEKICVSNPIPDEVHGEIRTTIGLARLLMNQKLKQFKELIDESEFKTGEKEITCLDLQGFWDMVYFEVEKINKCFYKLDKCKNNEWKFVEEKSEKLLKKKVPVTKDITSISKKKDSSKSHALAAKERLAEAKRKMLAQCQQQKAQDFVEIVQPNKEKLISVQDSNSVGSKKIINTAECSRKPLVKGSHMKVKQNLDVHKIGCIAVEKNEPGDEILALNDSSKHREIQRKSHSSSIQNKENFIPEDISYVKNISAVQTKPKMKNEAPVPEKSKRKPREFIKLQCVTRSAKKALLAQQNTIQKS